MKKKIRCSVVLFDLWGTLAQGEGITKKTQQAMGLQKYGFRFFIRRFEKATMLKNFSSLEKFALAGYRAFGLHPTKKQLKTIAGLWRLHLRKATLFPEAISVLKELKNRGFKLGLVTNTQNFGINPLLRRLKVLGLFDALLFSFSSHCLKPRKKLFLLALKELRAKPKSVVMVGDSATDVSGAHNAGLRGILVDRNPAIKKTCVPDEKVSNLGDLLGLLEFSCSKQGK